MAISQRIPQLDGVRALAILAVFLHHALHVKLTWMGVDLFFVLSGFLITGILIRRKILKQSYFGNFYARRARRILPPYLLTLLVTSLFIGWGWLHHWYWYAFFGMNIGAVRGELPREFGPLWSLAVEEQFYLVWPFVILFCSERILFRTSLCIILFTPILRGLATPHVKNAMTIYFQMPFRMDLLAAGGMLALVWKNHREWIDRSRRYCWVIVSGVPMTLILCSRIEGFSRNANTIYANVWMYELSLLGFTALLALVLG